jgi:hypothetical protein
MQKDGGGGGGPPETQETGTDCKMTETSLELCYTSIIYYLLTAYFIIMIVYLQIIEDLRTTDLKRLKRKQ